MLLLNQRHQDKPIHAGNIPAGSSMTLSLSVIDRLTGNGNTINYILPFIPSQDEAYNFALPSLDQKEGDDD